MFYTNFKLNYSFKFIFISTILLLSTIGVYINKINSLFCLTQQVTNINTTFNTIFTIILFTLLFIIILNKKTIMEDKKLLLIYVLFLIFIYFLIFTNSSLVFFIMYELLLLLTIVIVYYNSPNIRSKVIAFYFVLWTQISSFILWVSVSYIYIKLNTFSFNELAVSINNLESKKVISLLIFTSFAIKLPLWPFSFWLLKTHVEANTSFSIFLSGVLVKTALIGLIKFNFIFINIINPLYMYIIIFSLIATTGSISYQVDFKKLIAFTTVQEMTLITLFISYNNLNNSTLLVYFIVLHTVMSFLLFHLNELIYVRFKTRRTFLFLGIMTSLPKLNIIIILIWLLFISIPMSLKFFFEILILLKFFSLPIITLVTLIICLQFLTIIFFSKNTISMLFGNGGKVTYDLTKNDILNVVNPLLLLIVFIL